ncbi:unnamed protein product [Ambrosiozyma monospora]|uniref:Unnamed protein product n=1 Tax=Ambrosiozyma monospora TaxID=43982 RepID=A0ACB5SX96_AMBMO|nr:unnamed protein product [Ambrosiozyma monospora]
MGSFTFSANRLRNGNNNSQSTSSQKKQQTSSKYLELAKTDNYKIVKLQCGQPRLSQDEYILESYTDGKSSFAIQLTNQKATVYDYQNSKQSTQTPSIISTEDNLTPVVAYEFAYTPNKYNIQPQIKLIPNQIDGNKPGLVLVDSINGSVKFVETILLAPSMDVLPNEHFLQIPLRKGEFFIKSEYFDDLGFVLATNFKKVFLLTFKDQSGKFSLNVVTVLNPTTFAHYLMSSNELYSVEGYYNSNRIISMQCLDEDALTKKLIIQEEEGNMTLVRFIKNNGFNSVFLRNIKSDLASYVSSGVDKVKDIKPLANDRYLVVVSAADNSLMAFTIKLKDSFVVESSYNINGKSDTIPDSVELKLLLNNSFCLLSLRSSLVMFDAVATTADRWEDMINLKDGISIYGTTILSDNSLSISTDSGILVLEVSSKGRLSSPQEFVKSHIEQYLEYASSSPFQFVLSHSNIQILKSDVESSVRSIIDELLHNKSPNLKKCSILGVNIKKRYEQLKLLSNLVARDLDVNADIKLFLVTSLEKLHIGFTLFNLLDKDQNIAREFHIDGKKDDVLVVCWHLLNLFQMWLLNLIFKLSLI